MLSFIQRYALLMSGVSVLALASPLAFAATTGGIDTPTGVKTLPLAVEGNAIITLTDSPAQSATVSGNETINGNETVNGNVTLGTNNSMTIGGASGPLNATALTALVNLLNVGACSSGEALAKTGPTSFACIAIATADPVPAPAPAPAPAPSPIPTQQTDPLRICVATPGYQTDVLNAYKHILGRCADSGGWGWWLTQYPANVNLSQMQADFTSSVSGVDNPTYNASLAGRTAPCMSDLNNTYGVTWYLQSAYSNICIHN